MPVNRFDRTAYGEPPESDPSFDETEQDELDQGGPEALRRLQAQLGELADYARQYFSARKDALLANVRKCALWAMAGIVGFAILCTMLITATVLGMLGLAQIIGIGLGDRLWAGYLIVGFGLLLVVALGLVISIRFVQRRFHRLTVNKYAKRHQTQRARRGHDIQSGNPAERN
jgi:hypothetical protein